MNRPARRLMAVLIAAMLVACLAGVQAKGGGNHNDNNGGGLSVSINISIKFSAKFANFPLPSTAVLVAKNKQKHGPEWTEYRCGITIANLTVFYKKHMPGNGWKLRACRGNTWTWTRGNRTLVVMYVWVSKTVTLIAVKETKK